VASSAAKLPEAVADALRRRITHDGLPDGSALGREADLVEEFAVSRPSVREAIRILEAEGLVTVVRGARGGVVVRDPDERITARAVGRILHLRGVTVADVHKAQALVEAAVARAVAASPNRRTAAAHLDGQVGAAAAEPSFSSQLVETARNQTLTMLAAILDAVAPNVETNAPAELAARQRLVGLIAAGAASDAEEHWFAHRTATVECHSADGSLRLVAASLPE
jgi:DNA-binding FadR family transcriptional regulator